MGRSKPKSGGLGRALIRQHNHQIQQIKEKGATLRQNERRVLQSVTDVSAVDAVLQQAEDSDSLFAVGNPTPSLINLDLDSEGAAMTPQERRLLQREEEAAHAGRFRPCGDWGNPVINFGRCLPDYCRICKNSIRDHLMPCCPFMALSNQVDGTRAAPTSFSKYFPPVLSDAEKNAANYMRQLKMNLIRITNHLEDTYDEELENLFRNFGRVTRICIPYEGGNGFVNFSNRVGALRAIQNLNGTAYKDMILKVEWAYMRPQSP